MTTEQKTEIIKELAKEAAVKLVHTVHQEIENYAHEAISQNFDGLSNDEYDQLKELFKEYLNEYLLESI